MTASTRRCKKGIVASNGPPQPIESITLESRTGMRVTLLNLGATIQSIRVPVPNGHVDAILGYENHDDYWTDTAFMGATVGRYANRIRNATFSLGGRSYSLDANETSTGHCLQPAGRPILTTWPILDTAAWRRRLVDVSLPVAGRRMRISRQPAGPRQLPGLRQLASHRR